MSKTRGFKFSRYQWFVVAMLAFLQFTIVLDFLVLSPLGAFLIPALNLTTQQFGAVVSAYAFSAGISGILAGGFADRYDRKKLLLVFYVGFLIGNLLCASATDYYSLIAARIITGVFGGVIGAVVFAIITDLFSFEERGKVIGLTQTAFAASQVIGIPLSLQLSNHYGWQAPFYLILGFGALAGVTIFVNLKPINSHIGKSEPVRALTHLLRTATNRTYLWAFAATSLLTLGGFMIMPFGSVFTIHNLGIPMVDLPLIYMANGVVMILLGPLVGLFTDRIGKLKVFIIGSLVTIATISYYTRMEQAPIAFVILISGILYLGMFSRMIPSQALTSELPDADSRGAFAAVSSSIQQIAGGVGATLSGLMVVQAADGRLEHFDYLGNVICITAVISIFLVWNINRLVLKKQAGLNQD